jgi:hypothetical protein
VPLRGGDWYAENKIDLKLKTDVTALDARAKEQRWATAARSSSKAAAGDRRGASKASHPGANLLTSIHCARLLIAARYSASQPHARS